MEYFSEQLPETTGVFLKALGAHESAFLQARNPDVGPVYQERVVEILKAAIETCKKAALVEEEFLLAAQGRQAWDGFVRDLGVYEPRAALQAAERCATSSLHPKDYSLNPVQIDLGNDEMQIGSGRVKGAEYLLIKKAFDLWSDLATEIIKKSSEQGMALVEESYQQGMRALKRIGAEESQKIFTGKRNAILDSTLAL